MKRYKLRDLAELVHGEVEGEANLEIVGVADLRQAGPHELAFAVERSWLAQIPHSTAHAIVVPRSAADLPAGRSYLRVAHPRLAMARLLQVFDTAPLPAARHHELAAVAPTARIEKGVSIGPFVVIEEGAAIGEGTVLWPGTYIGAGAVVGEKCRIYANVTVRERCIIGRECIIHSGAVIGSDGFGFVTSERKHLKIPQIGIVRLGDRVEIGANATIDRATMGETVIGSGTKIDNLVQIAHNVELGDDCLIVAQVGIAGSSRLGRSVTMAGQSGVGGHLVIGDGAVITGQAGVTKSTPAGQTVSDSPARPHREALQLQALYQRLPRMAAEVKELRQRIAELERRSNGEGHAAAPAEPWKLARDGEASG